MYGLLVLRNRRSRPLPAPEHLSAIWFRQAGLSCRQPLAISTTYNRRCKPRARSMRSIDPVTYCPPSNGRFPANATGQWPNSDDKALAFAPFSGNAFSASSSPHHHLKIRQNSAIIHLKSTWPVLWLVCKQSLPRPGLAICWSLVALPQALTSFAPAPRLRNLRTSHNGIARTFKCNRYSCGLVNTLISKVWACRPFFL